ncbi:MAG: aspartyl protease family protein, partial [Candidatus Eremiobacteraeota bacterium]|nr:aspartyl protease family protein [Candidatus Eremiobacteraeota bacterium]
MSNSVMRAAAFAVASLTLILTTPSYAATVDDVLNRAHTALGGAALERVSALYERGTITITGVTGTFEQWSDTKTNRFAQYLNAGIFSGGNGFDGTDAWNQDASGFVWVDGGQAGRYGAIEASYLNNGDFLQPARRGAVTLMPRQTDKGITYDIVQATPPGGLPLTIWIDSTTHLPARVVSTIGIQTSTTTLSDYRSVEGAQIPYHQRQVTDTGNEFDSQTTSAQANPPDIAAHLNKPASQVNDASIEGGRTVVPIDLIDNHVYLSVMLNGKGPYRFAFDTGGSNLVDTSVAQTLGLSQSGAMQGGGVGNKTETISFAKIASLGIGSATLKDQYFAILPVRAGFSVAGGAPLDGLIGFEVLSRFTTTFDYAGKKLTLAMPGTNAPAPGADIIPFVFNNTIPQIPCQLDAVSANCSVDTGSRVAISVLTKFSTDHPSVVPSDASAVGVNGFGIGGPALGRVGRLASLQIGNTTLTNVIADFSAQNKGYFANPFIAGNIGGGVWRRFTVVFDYAKQTMALTPNADFSAAQPQDRSGLFLIEQAGVPVVLDARPNTPGAQAGLARGDAITTINKASTAGMDLQQI